MRFSLPILALATVPFAPADSARADGHTAHPVAEIVTFRLNAGVEDAQFLSDAKATDAIVRASQGFITRTLSKGEDGVWTDYILWLSLADAQSAAKTVVNDPIFAPFGQAIDFETVVMRHEVVQWQMRQ